MTNQTIKQSIIDSSICKLKQYAKYHIVLAFIFHTVCTTIYIPKGSNFLFKISAHISNYVAIYNLLPFVYRFFFLLFIHVCKFSVLDHFCRLYFNSFFGFFLCFLFSFLFFLCFLTTREIAFYLCVRAFATKFVNRMSSNRKFGHNTNSRIIMGTVECKFGDAIGAITRRCTAIGIYIGR